MSELTNKIRRETPEIPMKRVRAGKSGACIKAIWSPKTFMGVSLYKREARAQANGGAKIWMAAERNFVKKKDVNQAKRIKRGRLKRRTMIKILKSYRGIQQKRAVKNTMPMKRLDAIL